MRFVLILLVFSVAVCPVYGGDFRVTRLSDKLIVETDLFRVSFDEKHNFIITGLSYAYHKNFIETVQVVADVENGSRMNCLEGFAKTKKVHFRKKEDKFVVTVRWQNKYFDVRKTITVFRKYPIVSVHYDFYIIDKPALRVLAAPIIDFSDKLENISYSDRTGAIHSCKVADLAHQPFGKFSCNKPGIWYAAGMKDFGLVVVVPKLISEYGNFAWPPEFGVGRQLVRNYDVGKAGMFFPHKLAFGSPDTKFSATVVLSVYSNGNIKSAVEKISQLIKIEKPEFKSAPRNRSAQYLGQFNDTDVWVDWQSGVHRKMERLSRLKRVNKPFEICSAKNQYVSFQIILNSQRRVKLNNVYISDCPFESEIRLCKYIKLAEPSKIFPDRDVKEYPSYWPDPLIEFKPITLMERQNQGIWITFYVPVNGEAGKYNVKVKLGLDGKIIPINIVLRVFNFSLPSPRTFKNVTDIYGEMIKNGRGQNPSKHVCAYSSRIERLYADLFARYNLSVISYYEKAFEADVISRYWRRCSAVYLPGGDAMIIFEGRYWPKYANGRKYEKGDRKYLEAALTTFKKRIAYYRDSGVKGKIYAIVADDALYKREYLRFLSKFIRAVKKFDSQLVIAGCVKSNFSEEQADLFDVVITGVEVSRDVDKAICKAIENGRVLERWTVLNQWTAIDARPIELRSIFWRLFAKRITGSWHWDGLWFWFLTNDVYNCPQMNNWWGEGYLVYPPGDAPVPSIRLAGIRAGIDDYEYLTILNNFDGKHILKRIVDFRNLSVISLEKKRFEIAKIIERFCQKNNQKGAKDN